MLENNDGLNFTEPSDIDLNDQFRNVLLERNENGIVIGKIVE